MKKANCYSKFISLIYLFLLVISIVVGLLPFALFKNEDNITFKLLWILIILFSVLFSIFGLLFYTQYIFIKNNKIILKNLFGVITTLEINDCYYEINRLPSCYGRAYGFENWICIYSKNEINKFKYGYTNGKKYNRIQLICNKKNLEYVNNYIKHKYNNNA